MSEPFWVADVRAVADRVRHRVLGLTLDRNGGYLSQTLSSSDLLATLYVKSLALGPSEGPLVAASHRGVPGRAGTPFGYGASYNGARAADRDRLLISPAHYAVAIYATLVETGRLSPETFDSFNTDGSSVEMIGGEHSPGFELTTGSFGQALSQAGGIAFARKLRGETGRVVVMMSDGELEEGQTWEAVQSAAHYDLDNVIVCVGKRLVRMGIDNTYSQGATFPYLLRKHGLDALSLVGQIEAMTGTQLGISEDDLLDTRTEDAAARSTEQLEAL